MEKLVCNTLTDDLIDIAGVWRDLTSEYPELDHVESYAWKKECVFLDNSFADTPCAGYTDKLERRNALRQYARKALIQFAGIPMQPYYFTFGSWEGYPYHNTFLIAYGKTKGDAVRKFRKNYPDKYENTINCAFVYGDKTWHESDVYNGIEPVEVIW